MTKKEYDRLMDAFEQIIVKMVISYLKFDHFLEYKINFDTGDKVKEIYEICIKRVKGGEAKE